MIDLNNLPSASSGGGGGKKYQTPTLMSRLQRQGPVEACLKCLGNSEDGSNTCAWQGTQKAFEKR